MKTRGLIVLFTWAAISAPTGAAPATSNAETTRSGFSTNSANFSDPEIVNGNCQRTVTVSGNGIEDKIVVDCDIDAFVIASDDELIVSNVIYSDKPNSMVVVKDGQCVMKTYKDGETPTSSPMTSKDCEEVKKKMKEAKENAGGEGGESGSSSSGGSGGSSSSGEGSESDANLPPPGYTGYYAVVSAPVEVSGKCQRTVTVSGNGVSDKIIVDCKTDAHVIANNDQLVVGNVIYSDKPNTLVIIRDGKCLMKTYEDGKNTTMSLMVSKKCKEVQNKMKTLTEENSGASSGSEDGGDDSSDFPGSGSGYSGYEATISAPIYAKGKCHKTVTVSGNGVNDKISVDCDTDSCVIASNNELVVGKVIYSDKPNTLVVVKDGKCELKHYSEGVKTTSTIMSKRDCNKVNKKIQKAKANKSWGWGGAGNWKNWMGSFGNAYDWGFPNSMGNGGSWSYSSSSSDGNGGGWGNGGGQGFLGDWGNRDFSYGPSYGNFENSMNNIPSENKWMKKISSDGPEFSSFDNPFASQYF